MRRVLRLCCPEHGRSYNVSVAADLGLSQRTVENHRAAIMRKTGSKSLPALARVALAAAWNGTGEPFGEPFARVALAAAWKGAEGSLVERKSSVVAAHAQTGQNLDARAEDRRRAEAIGVLVSRIRRARGAIPRSRCPKNSDDGQSAYPCI
jgi:hypothetical protein